MLKGYSRILYLLL